MPVAGPAEALVAPGDGVAPGGGRLGGGRDVSRSTQPGEPQRDGDRGGREGDDRQDSRLEHGAPAARRSLGFGHPADPSGDQQVPMAGDGQHQPARGVWEIRPEVERVRGPRGRQPEEDRQGRPGGRRHPEGESGQRPEPDRHLRERDEQADRDGIWLAESHETADRRDADEHEHLGLDRAGAAGIEEPRVEELVEARVEERRAEEEAQGQEREGRDGPVHDGDRRTRLADVPAQPPSSSGRSGRTNRV